MGARCARLRPARQDDQAEPMNVSCDMHKSSKGAASVHHSQRKTTFGVSHTCRRSPQVPLIAPKSFETLTQPRRHGSNQSKPKKKPACSPRSTVTSPGSSAPSFVRAAKNTTVPRSCTSPTPARPSSSSSRPRARERTRTTCSG